MSSRIVVAGAPPACFNNLPNEWLGFLPSAQCRECLRQTHCCLHGVHVVGTLLAASQREGLFKVLVRILVHAHPKVRFRNRLADGTFHQRLLVKFASDPCRGAVQQFLDGDVGIGWRRQLARLERLILEDRVCHTQQIVSEKLLNRLGRFGLCIGTLLLGDCLVALGVGLFLEYDSVITFTARAITCNARVLRILVGSFALISRPLFCLDGNGLRTACTDCIRRAHENA